MIYSQNTSDFVIWLVFIAGLLPVCCVSDIRRRQLQTWEIIAGLVLLAGYLLTSTNPLSAIVSGVLCFLLLMLIRFFADGPGGGDIKIISITACFILFINTMYALLAGMLLALVFLMIRKRSGLEVRGYKLPLVPFFFAGVVLTLIIPNVL